MMQTNELKFLLTSEGQRLLEEVSNPPISASNHLPVAAKLRKRVDPILAQAVIETVLLRQRAITKFSRAAEMYFVRAALEQASAEVVANYRAAKYSEAGLKTIADLGCGIGGDAAALSAKADVIGMDLDPVRVAMAGENVRVYGNEDRFLAMLADSTAVTVPQVDAFFFDPARRDERGKRIKSVMHYDPPLATIDLWRDKTSHGAVKVSPAIDYAEIPAGADIEFISVKGAVKEGILWYGDLRDGAERRATLLPSGHTISTDDYSGETIAARLPSSFLYEPDGAVIRAHLVQTLARHLGSAQIDPEIAYLSADSYQETPFARCFKLEVWFPFQLKRLRSYLRENKIGKVTIKKRGSPLDPDSLRQQLRLRGDEHRILFLTHVMGEPAVLIGDEISDTKLQTEQRAVE